MEPISARSIIDAVSTGDSKRKDERRQRLSSAALAAADRKVQSAYSPIVIAGVLRLIDFVLISFIGLALYFGYGTAAVGDSWRYRILALGIAAATVAILQALDIYQVPHFQAGFLPHPAIATLLVRSFHSGGRPISYRKTGRCFVASMVCRILLCRNCCTHLRTICSARCVA